MNTIKHTKENNLNQLLKEISEYKHKNNNELREYIVKDIYSNAEEILDGCIKKDPSKTYYQEKIDDIITSKTFGIPIMLFLLALVLWITIEGANYPSELLSKFFFDLEGSITNVCRKYNVSPVIHGVFVLGLYRTLAWVISVMLPPMAIFFPIFTLLEDLGYLPRVCFNLDHAFKKACAHGKQCLTMCMGFGCNAAGIISCRIIDSPRERLIAILTNNFIPCNGRFPTLIAISSIFFGMNLVKGANAFVSALIVTLLIILGIVISLLVSFILSKTLLKGIPSSFTLELPPYRKPQIGRVIYTSIIDRTIFVLGRAMLVAAPAGAITYILSNVYIGDLSIVSHIAQFLNPFAKLMGLDGFILMAFILGFPANEIVLPILMMCYLASGSMVDFQSLDQLKNILLQNGWTSLTALNTMLFSLLHFPCATTVLTIRKETGSKKWTLFSILLPTLIAIIVCMFTTGVYNLFKLIL
ncbi:nucleoside recognition domain-containing protein [Hathewaya limosa]|uniref:Ferrous iron transport protein B n=1 Tax=Hathewaya limosa TaxID=1536 RepID=A0ABU0JSL9_HATLI|nr:ferrous iron transport protein B [Hathewaya limosa]